MNKLPGNPYSDEAQKTAAYYTGRNVETDTDVIALGQMGATMALAFEQRTANLIAWHAFIDAQGDLPDHTAEISKQIQERLGL